MNKECVNAAVLNYDCTPRDDCNNHGVSGRPESEKGKPPKLLRRARAESSPPKLPPAPPAALRPNKKPHRKMDII